MILRFIYVEYLSNTSFLNRPSFGHGRISQSKSNIESVSRTRRQNGHASNSYKINFGCCFLLWMHSSKTVFPYWIRAMEANPEVATSNVLFLGLAASPPPMSFSNGHRKESTFLLLLLFSSSSEAQKIRPRWKVPRHGRYREEDECVFAARRRWKRGCCRVLVLERCEDAAKAFAPMILM